MSPQLHFSKKLEYEELLKAEKEATPIQAYDGLAEYWQGYALLQALDYRSFLERLAERRGLQPSSILDLACGTGTLAESLSEWSPVVGLDRSEAMLAQAVTRCGSNSKVRFFRGDFLNFEVDQRFDIVVCTANSLNYVRTVEELHGVFSIVARHMKDNGIFVFDTVTYDGMLLLSGNYLHVDLTEKRFAIRFQYNAQLRQERSLAILSSGVEEHLRIALDPSDVRQAAKNSGLRLDQYFSSATLPGWWYTGASCFFVLTKRP